jgi:hypothetical protein
MTLPSLTPDQEVVLTEALEVARLLEQQSKEMSDRATEIADKYYKRRHEAALAVQKNSGNS